MPMARLVAMVEKSAHPGDPWGRHADAFPALVNRYPVLICGDTGAPARQFNDHSPDGVYVRVRACVRACVCVRACARVCVC